MLGRLSIQTNSFWNKHWTRMIIRPESRRAWIVQTGFKIFYLTIFRRLSPQIGSEMSMKNILGLFKELVDQVWRAFGMRLECVCSILRKIQVESPKEDFQIKPRTFIWPATYGSPIGSKSFWERCNKIANLGIQINFWELTPKYSVSEISAEKMFWLSSEHFWNKPKILCAAHRRLLGEVQPRGPQK